METRNTKNEILNKSELMETGEGKNGKAENCLASCE